MRVEESESSFAAAAAAVAAACGLELPRSRDSKRHNGSERSECNTFSHAAHHLPHLPGKGNGTLRSRCSRPPPHPKKGTLLSVRGPREKAMPCEGGEREWIPRRISSLFSPQKLSRFPLTRSRLFPGSQICPCSSPEPRVCGCF